MPPKPKMPALARPIAQPLPVIADHPEEMQIVIRLATGNREDMILDEMRSGDETAETRTADLGELRSV